jgi:HlyD family secretion protein
MSGRNYLIIIAVSVATIGGLGWAFTPRPLRIDTGLVSRGAFVENIEDDGVTRVRERYTITAPVVGTLLRPSLKAGDVVARNDVVATILPGAPGLLDPRTRSELLARREAAEARSARVRTLVRQAETARHQAELDVRRLEELAAQGYVSKTQREQTALTLDARRRELEAAKFEADASLHDLEQSRAAVTQLTDARQDRQGTGGAWAVRAPIAARVLTVFRESEGPVTAGANLLEVGNTGELEAVVDVLSTEATRIRPGAAVSLRAGDNTAMTGRVRVIEPAAHTKISALGVEEQRVNVIIDITPTDESRARVGDGYRVDAQIEVGRWKDAMQVPTAALFRDKDEWAVYVVREGRARTQTVKVGVIGPYAATVEAGLKDGDVVVNYPSDDLEPGRRVTPAG